MKLGSESYIPLPDDSASPAWTYVRHGMLAGLWSGLLFSMAASGVALWRGMAWYAPVRLIAAIILGREALSGGDPLEVIGIGMFLHFAFTIATGIIFAWLVARVSVLANSGALTFAAALVYALLWWLVSFYVFAPLVGWNWFAERTDFWTQLLLQVGVWGGALGLYFARASIRQDLLEQESFSTRSPSS